MNEIKARDDLKRSTHGGPQKVPKSLQKIRIARLGKIKNASQGQFCITNRDMNIPHIKGRGVGVHHRVLSDRLSH